MNMSFTEVTFIQFSFIHDHSLLHSRWDAKCTQPCSHNWELVGELEEQVGMTILVTLMH